MTATTALTPKQLGRRGLILLALILGGCGGGGGGGNDDDSTNSSTPTLRIEPAEKTEGDTGTSDLIFMVSVATASSDDISFDYTTAVGTADTSDFVDTTGTATMAAGATSASIAVAITGDTTVETDETFTLTLSNPVNATIAAAMATGTIVNDDFPLLTISDGTALEGNTGQTVMQLSARLDRASPESISVEYVSSDATATAGDDYVAAIGTLNFAAGELEAFIDIPILGDTDLEPDEQFVVNLTNPSANARIGDDEAIAIITNDDLPLLSLIPGSVIESDSETRNLAFAIELSAAASEDIIIGYQTADRSALAGVDYTGAEGTLTLVAGQTLATINVDVLGDTLIEPPEAFRLELTSVAGPVSTQGLTAIGSIIDDDTEAGPPLLWSSDAMVAEGDDGNTPLQVAVLLDQILDEDVAFDFETTAGTATDDDYINVAGRGVIAAGTTSFTIDIAIVGDTQIEGDETFSLTFDNVSGEASFALPSPTITIDDDDTPVVQTPSVAISNASVVEGNTGTSQMIFEVTLSTTASSPISVDFATEDGSAVADFDYLSTNGLLSFAPGSVVQTVSVEVVGDTFAEDDETFRVRLSNLTGNAVFERNTAIGTIETDEALARLSVADVSQAEGDVATSEMLFSVTLDVPSTSPTVFDYTTQDGTATAGDDYLSTSGSIEIAALEQSATISVSINGDTQNEADESFTLQLQNISSNVVATRDEATGVLVNDDGTPGWAAPVNLGRGRFPDAAMNATGNGGIVFVSNADPALSDDAVAVAAFHAGALSAPVLVAQPGILAQPPRIAMADGHKTMVVWAQNGWQSGVSTDGTLWDIQTATDNAGFFARLDGNTNGDIALVLESDSDNTDPADILSNLYRGSTDLWDGTQTLAIGQESGIRPPLVAMDHLGNRMVIWSQSFSDIDISGVYYRYYSVASDTWTGATHIPDTAFTRNVYLDALADGRMGLTLQQNAFISTPDVAELWLFEPGTNTWSLAGSAQTDISRSGFVPEFAADAAGNLIVAWVQLNDDGQYDVYANRYTHDTATFGEATLLETAPGSATPADGGVEVAMDESGNAIVVWAQILPNDSGEAYRIRAARYTLSDDEWSAAEQIDDDSIQSGAAAPAMAMDAQGNAIVTWHYPNEFEVGATHYVAP